MQLAVILIGGWIALSVLLAVVWSIAAGVGYQRALEDVRRRASTPDADTRAEVVHLQEVDSLMAR